MAYTIILDGADDDQEREELKRMFTVAAPAGSDASPDSEEWVPAWWGTDEANAAEGKQFAAWTQKMRPVDD